MQSLPRELLNHISTFDPTHRERFAIVLAELDEEVNWTYCDNDICEKDVHMLSDDYITKIISGREYGFCCEHCESYGSWSIQYDLRKMSR